MTGTTRALPTSAVPAASARLVTTLSADHSPDAREQAIAWRPRSSSSWRLPGANTGTRSAASSASEALGIVEERHAGSSPQSASTPPRGSVPTRLPCLIASPARSTPGAFAYQTPTTPSTRGPGSEPTSWLPHTAVAPSSSLMARRCTIPCSSSSAAEAPELEVEARQRRARVARDQRPGAQAGEGIGAVLVEQHAHDRLDAGEEDPALLELVAVGEGGLAIPLRHDQTSHGLVLYQDWTDSMHRCSLMAWRQASFRWVRAALSRAQSSRSPSRFAWASSRRATACRRSESSPRRCRSAARRCARRCACWSRPASSPCAPARAAAWSWPRTTSPPSFCARCRTCVSTRSRACSRRAG